MTDAPTANCSAADRPGIIRVRDLTVKKKDRLICRVPELEVSPGERVGIVGPNGSGKTTLLRVLAGFEQDFSGTRQLTMTPAGIVLVHQTPFLFRGSVLHNITYGLAARSVPRSRRRDMGREWLALFGMADFENRNVSELSGGERRRVAMARAGILQPNVLLLDEPLSELDQSGIESVDQFLDRLPDTTILIASPTPLSDGLIQRTMQLTNDY